MGWVGSSIAASILHRGIARELILDDLNQQLAEGEAMDFAHGASMYPSALVRAAPIEDMRSCDAVVIAAGRNGTPGQSRLELLKVNATVVRDICARLRGLRGLLVMVTNPVDVLTHVALEASGLDPARVLGTGTLLDTARLRQVLGRQLAVDPRSVHAQVVGEHGDSEVALWSSARIGGKSLRGWEGWSRVREQQLGLEVRQAAYEIIKRKGATNHAIGLVTASLLAWALRDERRILTVSRLQTGAAGLGDVVLSLPTIVGRDGATTIIEPDMDDEERALLLQSADVLRRAKTSLVT
jgi:L-lactate dehydrogenase